MHPSGWHRDLLEKQVTYYTENELSAMSEQHLRDITLNYCGESYLPYSRGERQRREMIRDVLAIQRHQEWKSFTPACCLGRNCQQ